MTRRHTIEGIPINTQGMDDLFARIRTWIRDGETPRIIVAANAAKLVAARRDIELRRALLAADWVLPDGMGVVWASRGEIPERLTGCDVAEGLLEHAAEQGWSVYLLGGRSHVVERAACVLRKRLPGLRLVGHHHGYLTEAAEAEVVASIAATAPDLLLVGMGSPRQERFLVQRAETLGVPCSVAVGGTLDVLAGRVKRAPMGIQSRGLEWAWRSFWEPRRVFTTRFAHTVLFAVGVAIDRLKNSS